jgi:CheY-like chemotaxis protein
VTRLALRKFEFQQRGLELISAHSAREAQSVFRERAGIALAIIDVVMETEHAGLELVRWVRDTGQSPLTRLVLRTGQAGMAPEEQVVRQFDIDAYREKTELTALKLRSLLYTSLRAHQALADKQQAHDSLLDLMADLPRLRAAADPQQAERWLRARLTAHFQWNQMPEAWPLPPDEPPPSGLQGERRARLLAYLRAASAAWPHPQAVTER